MTTLIIDDSLDNLEAIKEHTAIATNELVICCQEFEASLTVIKTNLSIRRIFLDINMPGVQGLEGIAKVKEALALSQNTSAHLVAMSVRKESLKGAVAAGADFTLDTAAILTNEAETTVPQLLALTELSSKVAALEKLLKRTRNRVLGKWFLWEMFSSNPTYVLVGVVFAIANLEATISILTTLLEFLKQHKGG